ncbi:hypothetical protein KMC50_gp48 [Ralstonia phage Claudette]|uniref:Uncharacterized protein n=2 Tax=Gervaisevirus claudettte TaxID=2846041 RepID=A0A7G5B861_9CAUD|nr:hypothetical protein KMC50_gp48 [Ralstonia phage Claudette]QMV32484.1 hypothetical protein 20A_00035 [Ralstonia phage Alix]QPD96366.1 hypothetical protein 20Ca_00048 [Ralstonia phage Claudette]
MKHDPLTIEIAVALIAFARSANRASIEMHDWAISLVERLIEESDQKDLLWQAIVDGPAVFERAETLARQTILSAMGDE